MEKEYLKAADEQEDQKREREKTVTGHLVHVYFNLDGKAGCGKNWAFEVFGLLI